VPPAPPGDTPADGSQAGDIDLWQSRQAAEAVYTAAWAAFVRGKYGSDPHITWLERPVVMDNVTDTIVSD
jgi:hypothetical protein